MRRWAWGSRRDIARAYAASSARMKEVLLGRAKEEGEEALREARGALRDLNAFGGRRHLEMERWLGEFDSPQTVLEEWPWLGLWVPRIGLERKGERVVGPEPPGWLRKWGPVVSVWERERLRGLGWGRMGEVLREVYRCGGGGEDGE